MGNELIKSKTFCPVMKEVVEIMRGVKWCLIGGRAVEAHTNPPQTPDIDILCDGSTTDAWDLLRVFKQHRIELTMPYEDGFIMFLADKKTGVEIDVMPSYDLFDIRAIRRASRFKCGSVTFPLVQPEDLVIMKAQAACDAGGGMMGRTKEKIKHDLEAIRTLAEEVDLDKKYIVQTLRMERWFEELRLLKKLGAV